MVEVLVFRRDEGVDQSLRNSRDGNSCPILLCELIENGAVFGVHLGGKGRARILQFFKGGEAPGDIVAVPDEEGQNHHGKRRNEAQISFKKSLAPVEK